MRVSTAEQSCELQDREAKAYLAARGWGDVTIYEESVTGTHVKREQFQRLMADARSRRLDIVLVWKLDRFARSLRDLVVHVQELTDLGVDFVSIKDNLDLTTSAGRLMTHLLGAFAEFEASIIRERCRAGVAAAKAKGTRFGRPPSLDPQRVNALRAQGLSLSAVARAVGSTKSGVSKVLARQGLKRGENANAFGQPLPASKPSRLDTPAKKRRPG